MTRRLETSIPISRVIREDGTVELPIVLDFDFSNADKVVGYAVVDPDMLPTEPNYVFSLGYVAFDDGRYPEVTCLGLVNDNDYAEILREESALEDDD